MKLDREQFLTRIETSADLPDDVSAEGAARAMGKVLRRRVDEPVSWATSSPRSNPICARFWSSQGGTWP